MLKVLIVEDEPGIYVLIKSLIEWEELGLEFAGYAANAKSALDIILQVSPDIVISDIAMPQMTGLEMIHKTRELGYNTKFIIISGYSNFEYAQQAIHDNVDSYLLKPISSTELNCSLKRIASALQTQQDKQNNNQYKLRQSFINDLLAQASIDKYTIDQVNKEFHFNFKEGAFSVGMIHFDIEVPHHTSSDPASPGIGGDPANDPTDVCVGGGPVNQNIYYSNIVSYLSDALSPYTYDMEISEQTRYLIFVINYAKTDINAVKAACLQVIDKMLFHKMISQEFNITIGFGKTADNISNIQQSFATAADAVKSRPLLGINSVIYADELNYDIKPEKRFFSDEENKQLSVILDTCDDDDFKGFIRKQVEKDIAAASACPYKLYDFVNETLHFILARMAVQGLIHQNFVSDSNKILSKLRKCFTREMLINTLCEELAAFIDLNSNNNMENTRLIKTALGYINNNYSEKITLEDVASRIYITPHYFGILFKNTTGTSFSNYLINLRIDKARHMLKDIQYRISEISRLIGYNDSKYFCRLFKERVGVSPNEYRKLHHRRY